MSECRILFCNIFPQTPAATGTHLGISVWCMVLIAINCALGTASVCDKYEIVFRQNDSGLDTLYFTVNGFCHFLSIFDIKNNVRYFGIELEFHARILKIFFHRKNQGFVLIIACKFQCGKIRQSGNMVDKPLEIQFHFQCTVPVFKSKHRAPVQPEGRVKDFLIKHILDGLIIQIFILCHKQLHDFHAALLTQIKFAIGMCILTTVFSCTAKRIVWIFFVQPVILVQHGCPFDFQ